MDSEYDPIKDQSNIARHGLSLKFGEAVLGDANHLVVPTHRPEDGEERWKALGRVDEQFYTAVYVWRGGVIRFISVRRSNAGEERLYNRAIGRSG
jgi:uncharacterized protein